MTADNVVKDYIFPMEMGERKTFMSTAILMGTFCALGFFYYLIHPVTRFIVKGQNKDWKFIVDIHHDKGGLEDTGEWVTHGFPVVIHLREGDIC